MKRSNKILSGLSAAVLTTSLAACGDGYEEASLPEEPTGYECDDWDWDDVTESYYCDDDRSPHYGSYFLLGSLFRSKSALKNSSSYKTYKANGGATGSGFNSGTSKSGLGSGSKGGFGG